LFGTGLDLATAGYNPLKSQFGLAQDLESAGQNALTLGTNLGGLQTQAGANVGQTLFAGGTNAARAMEAANAYSPLGSTISGLANNRQLTQGLSNWMSPATSSSAPSGNVWQTGAYADPGYWT
jgi:hypothetical protein